MCGGVSATAVFYPLDNLRIRQQVEKGGLDKQSVLAGLQNILQEEGLFGWYKGLKSSIVAIAYSNLVYFYWYEFLKKMAIRVYLTNGKKSLSDLENLCIASIAGCVNVMLTNPVWVVNTRIKLQKTNSPGELPAYTGTFQGLQKVYREEGLEGLWRGVIPSLALVSNPAIQFAAYERLKRIYIKLNRGKQPTALEFFFIGAAAKAIATLLTYPIQIIQSRLRAHKNEALKTKTESQETMQSVAFQIWKEGGLSAFFNGLSSKMLQTVSAAAFMFVVYEKVQRFAKLFVELVSRRRLSHMK
jgi:adenine nucleotide transporter 17